MGKKEVKQETLKIISILCSSGVLRGLVTKKGDMVFEHPLKIDLATSFRGL